MAERIKRTKGRQKIEIKLIEDKIAKTISFSKRRTGLFTKASELSVICGAMVGVIVFSPCGRAFSLGHPSIDFVIDRFLDGDAIGTRGQGLELHEPVDMEKVRKNVVRLLLRDVCEKLPMWWDASVENMRLEELSLYEKALMELKGKIADEATSSATDENGSLVSNGVLDGDDVNDVALSS